MPKNENNENLEATQAPAEFTPEAPQAEAENVTPIETARNRKLGTGAIVGISAAGVALLAGVFGSGVAVANTMGHGADRGPAGMSGQNLGEMAQGGQMPGGQMGEMDGDGDGPHGHRGPQGGQKPGGQMSGDTDGPMSGNMPHQHDANGNDIVPDGTATTTPGATTN